MEPRISIVTLGVSNLGASTIFYRDGLQLPLQVDKSSATFACFEVNRGSLWLALHPADLLAEDAQVSPDGSGFRGFTLAHNLRDPAGVDRLFARAIAAGARPIKSPRPASWGGYSGYFADPDGFLWELAHNPFSWIE